MDFLSYKKIWTQLLRINLFSTLNFHTGQALVPALFHLQINYLFSHTSYVKHNNTNDHRQRSSISIWSHCKLPRYTLIAGLRETLYLRTNFRDEVTEMFSHSLPQGCRIVSFLWSSPFVFIRLKYNINDSKTSTSSLATHISVFIFSWK